ncbi:MAG: SDR family oxidoreductase [Candidatus Methylomirabilota bacterium]
MDTRALFDLSGKVAVVTGGASGIGYAIAEGLASAGAKVVIAARSVDRIERAAATLRERTLEVAAHPVDVTDRASVERLEAGVRRLFGPAQILVNSAAVIHRVPIEETTDAQWTAMLDTNLRGTFFCCQIFGREMLARKQGKIINISSNVSQLTMPLRGVYAVTKAGVSHLTRAFAVEWAPRGVAVNAIAPGPTVTELNQRFFDEHPKDRQEREASIPLGRLGTPRDYVGAALLLASDASAFITGQTYFVDGGSNLI